MAASATAPGTSSPSRPREPRQLLMFYGLAGAHVLAGLSLFLLVFVLEAAESPIHLVD